MPLYEYQCGACGEKFEVIQKFADQPVTTHEKCGGAVRRLISPSAFHFKGSGWYVNDYAKSGAPQPPAQDNGKVESKDTKDTKDTKTDSAPKADSSATPAPATPAPSADKSA